MNGRIHGDDDVTLIPSVTMGLAVDMGWPGFVRTSTVVSALETAAVDQIAALEAAALALEVANASLLEQNEELVSANGKLQNQMKAMKKNAGGGCDADAFFAGMAPMAVYFQIGKSTLAPDEMQHLDYIARNILTKADKQSKVYITVMGSADSNTGTPKVNKKLSEARGQYVFDLLTNRYGISKDRLVVKSEVVKAASDPALDRAVTFSF